MARLLSNSCKMYVLNLNAKPHIYEQTTHTVDSCYNDTDKLVIYHRYNQNIVIYELRDIKRYLQIFIQQFERWMMGEVPHV